MSVAAPVSSPRTLSTKRAACAWVVIKDAVSASIGVGRESTESGTAADRNGASAERDRRVECIDSWLRRESTTLLRAAAVDVDVARSMSGPSRRRVIFLSWPSDNRFESWANEEIMAFSASAKVDFGLLKQSTKVNLPA